MEAALIKLTWSIVFLSAALLLLVSWRRARNASSSRRRPPGPPGWPVIGNMFDLGTIPHQTLYSLRTRYGPILWLQLGTMNTVVIQSARAAAEMFKNNDLSFSDRKVPDSLTAMNYDQGALSLNPYGPYWRLLRRLYSKELLVNKRIQETAPVRQKCVDNMINWIEEDSLASRARGESGEVQISHFLFLMSFNLVGNLMLSRDLLNSQSKDGVEFFDAMNKVMEWAGKPNLADFFPFLKRLDPLGIKRGSVHDMGRAMKIIDKFVKERIQERKSSKEKAKQNFLDVLLEYKGEGKEEEPDKISESNTIIAMLEMFFAGSETTSSTIEWAMTELLRNPESMRKVKEELDQVVGQTRKVEESDFDELPILQAVVKETFRLHPVVPLLLPRSAVQDTNYMGYFIPKGTQVLVNAWAIGKDQESWDDPLSFKPERFMGSNIEYNGQHFELIPFGAGRRICVGYSLAHRVVHLGLATLLHSFDWELGSNMIPETIDMGERMGIIIRKLVPLKAIPTRRVVRG